MTRSRQPDLFSDGYGAVREASPRHDFRPWESDPGCGFGVDAAMADLCEADALTLLLRRCSPACPDPSATAETLLQRFGCWPRVMGATLAELALATGEPVARDLKLVRDLLLRGLQFEVRKRSVLGSWGAIATYLRALLAGQARESFRVLFLDKANGLIADELMGDGTVDHAPVYPREIMRRALELNASACCLVHNHPTGNAAPSSADIDMTRMVVDAGRALGILVHDHFLVGGDEVVSFKTQGLM
jgi:DNA repair protein RadC